MRYPFLVAAGLFILTLSVFTFRTMRKPTTLPTCKNCNVILISVDTLSALHLPCYGYHRNTAPFLCGLAKSGVYFPHSYSQSFYTLPSHFSLFTSLYPTTHRVLSPLIDSLHPTYPTLAQTLKERGYKTLYFGSTRSMYLPLDKGIERGFDYIHPAKVGYYLENRSTDDWQQALAMIRASNRDNTPAFVFLHTMAVHDPYFTDADKRSFGTDTAALPRTEPEFFTVTPDIVRFAKTYWQTYAPSYPLSRQTQTILDRFLASNNMAESIKLYESLIRANQELNVFTEYYYGLPDQYKPEVIGKLQDLYDEAILSFDKKLEMFMRSFDTTLLNNTIIIITADHGEAFGEHGARGHTTLHGEVTQVPLILRIPKATRITIPTPAQSIDVFPTILSLVGITDKPHALEGSDLTTLPSLAWTRQEKPIIQEKYERNEDGVMRSEKTVILYPWKLYIRDMTSVNASSFKLYHIANDPWEKDDVSKMYPNVIKRLVTSLNSYLDGHPLITYTPSGNKDAINKEGAQKEDYFHY